MKLRQDDHLLQASHPGSVSVYSKLIVPSATHLLHWQHDLESVLLALGNVLSDAYRRAEHGMLGMTRFGELVDEAARTSAARLSETIASLPTLVARDAAERKFTSSLYVELISARRSVSELSSRLSTLAQLALLARIETAALDGQAGAFDGFTSEVDTLVEEAEAAVATLAEEINLLLCGVAGVQNMDQRGTGTSMDDTIASINALLLQAAHHREQNRGTMTAVGEQFESLKKETGRLVTALQFHDAMRQRLEHIEFGLERLSAVRQRNVLTDDDLVPLSDLQKRLAVGAIATLQSSQLYDLAATFEQQSRDVVNALVEMSSNVNSADATFRTTWGDQTSNSMALLEAAVSNIVSMLDSYAQSRSGLAHAREIVLHGIKRMAQLAGKLEEIEVAIRLVGLNATFRSAQLSGAGGPMKCIAQELRTSAAQIAQAVLAFGAELTSIGVAAEKIKDGGLSDPAGDPSMLTTDLSEGLAELRKLEIDGAELRLLVHGSLDGLAATFAAQAKKLKSIGGSDDMRYLGDQLNEIARKDGMDTSDSTLWPALNNLLEKTYTTKSERDVHAHAQGRTGQGAENEHVEQDVDDMLF